MGKRKKTNGCLLVVLRLGVLASFALLMGGYGIYKLMTAPIQLDIPDADALVTYIEALQESNQQNSLPSQAVVPTVNQEAQVDSHKQQHTALGIKNDSNITSPHGEAPQLDTHESEVITEQGVVSETIESEPVSTVDDEVEEILSGSALVSEDVKVENKPTEVLESVEDEQAALSEDERLSQTFQYIKEELPNKIVSTALEAVQMNDLPIEVEEPLIIYDYYTLALDDTLLEEIKQIIQSGEIDVPTLFNRYTAHLTVEEKSHLMQMMAEKATQINIQEIMTVVQDGIDTEDVVFFESMVQELFTEEEIETLYTYYVKSDFASEGHIEP